MARQGLSAQCCDADTAHSLVASVPSIRPIANIGDGLVLSVSDRLEALDGAQPSTRDTAAIVMFN